MVILGKRGKKNRIALKYKATTTDALNLNKTHHLMITEQCGLSGRRFLYLLQS